MAQLKQKFNGTKLAKLRHQVSSSLLQTIYFALFDSHLRYVAKIWGQGSNNVVDMVKSSQNKAPRIISFKDKTELSDPQNFEITKYHYIEQLPVYL